MDQLTIIMIRNGTSLIHQLKEAFMVARFVRIPTPRSGRQGLNWRSNDYQNDSITVRPRLPYKDKQLKLYQDMKTELKLLHS